MKIIVPMAGRGSRLRPHTLTIPKPLIPIAGKPIVHRLVEDIASVCNEKVDEIAFIIGDFGIEVENNLISIAESLGSSRRDGFRSFDEFEERYTLGEAMWTEKNARMYLYMYVRVRG